MVCSSLLYLYGEDFGSTSTHPYVRLWIRSSDMVNSLHIGFHLGATEKAGSCSRFVDDVTGVYRVNNIHRTITGLRSVFRVIYTLVLDSLVVTTRLYYTADKVPKYHKSVSLKRFGSRISIA